MQFTRKKQIMMRKPYRPQTGKQVDLTGWQFMGQNEKKYYFFANLVVKPSTGETLVQILVVNSTHRTIDKYPCYSLAEIVKPNVNDYSGFVIDEDNPDYDMTRRQWQALKVGVLNMLKAAQK